MPVLFRCEYCRGKLSIARRKIGYTIVCPKCTMEITVPDIPEEPAAEPELEPNVTLDEEHTDHQHALPLPTEVEMVSRPGPPYQPHPPSGHSYPRPPAGVAPAYADPGYSTPNPSAHRGHPIEHGRTLTQPHKPIEQKPARKKDSLFEGADIERLLSEKLGPEPLPDLQPKKGESPIPVAPAIDPDAIILSRMKASIIFVVFVISLGLSFVAGFYIRGH